MMMLKVPETTEKRLMLGDYVSVYESGSNKADGLNTGRSAVLVNREALFQRIQQQRGTFLPLIQKQKGDLIDVRLRAAAKIKMKPKHFSEITSPEGKFVA